MKKIITVLLCVVGLNVMAQTIFHDSSGTLFIASWDYPREKYTDTVLATIAYMVNDSSIRIIKTRVSQCEYYVSDNYNESHWIQRDIEFLDVDEDKIIKTISVKFPEHFNHPKPL